MPSLEEAQADLIQHKYLAIFVDIKNNKEYRAGIDEDFPTAETVAKIKAALSEESKSDTVELLSIENVEVATQLIVLKDKARMAQTANFLEKNPDEFLEWLRLTVEALKEGREQFDIQGNPVVTGFAKWMCIYLIEQRHVEIGYTKVVERALFKEFKELTK